MDYHNKKFRPVQNSVNAATTADTIFEYKQYGNILTAEYKGGHIRKGHLIGLVDEEGNIDMRYHQISKKGELMTGICFSKPEVTAEGKIRLHENWQWTSGDQTSGKTILEEI